MRGSWLLLALAACGRIGFDASSRFDDAAPPDAPGADAAVIPPGARIWLRMETDPATGILDSAGGHTVTCAVNGCPTQTAGVNGSGYEFGGQEVEIADAADLDSSAGFTGAIWVRAPDFGADLECVWTKSFDNANGYDTFTLCIMPDGTTVFDGEQPDGTAESENGPVLSRNAWHHLAITWDGTTRRGYVDGAMVVSTAVTLGSGTEPMALGGSRSSYFFAGSVDEALYYTRALSGAEIAQLATP